MTEAINEEVKEAAKPARAAKPKKVRIKILATEEEKGDVFLAVNGKNIVIKRGEPVEVDPMYIGVLNDSVISTIVHDYDADGRKVSKHVQLQRYPFQILG